MCGLIGIASKGNLSSYSIIEGLDSLKHRGPDSVNFETYRDCVIGHRRLSINDLSENGSQPMVHSLTGVSLTVNGEIYNFKELKNLLKDKYIFKSNSDSEVVLYLYLEFGFAKTLEFLDGMFAIAIYDPRISRVFLGRDRAGVKPLYYYHKGDTFSWSSEISALKATFKNLEINMEGCYDYFTYNYIPAPKTIYKDVFKLQPGKIVTFNIESCKLSYNTYFNLTPILRDYKKEDLIDRIKYEVNKSTREQMVSDAKIGFLLSGGLDSSIVLNSALKTGDLLDVFTLKFNDSNDESKYAKQLNSSGIFKHHIIEADNSYRNLIDSYPIWFAEPYNDTSALPSYVIMNAVKSQHIKVVLGGDGGDELFGGYSRYLYMNMYDRNPKISSSLLASIYKRLFYNYGNSNKNNLAKSFANRYVLTNLELYTKVMGGLLKEEKVLYASKYGIPADYDDYWYFRENMDTSMPPFLKYRVLDFRTYLHEDILTKVDRVAMRNSIENRVPLLSNTLINLAFSLNKNFLYDRGRTKSVLRDAYKRDLPIDIINRDKQGFRINMNHYMFDDLSVQQFVFNKFDFLF
jgi:asparagine synthase (glutamine-hydrolysing)